MLRTLLRRTFPVWERLGFHITPNHFYEPIPDTRKLPEELWSSRSELVGIDLRSAAQLALLDELARAYGADWARFPRDKTADPHAYYVDNRQFEGVDGEILYGLVRKHRPRRVVEIGSGFSTLLTAQALRDNGAGELEAIEPFPPRVLRRHPLPRPVRLRAQPVQSVPLAEFAALAPGDILFIDSSHVVKTGSDVVYEFLEILPRLGPGVLVHVHDIFLPAEYPRAWIKEERRFWTEQYLLQAFLAFNTRFEVVWASSYMHLTQPDALEAAIPSYRRDRRWPGSFWLRRVG